MKLFSGSSNPCSGLVLKPMRAPLSSKIKYLGRQFFICSPEKEKVLICYIDLLILHSEKFKLE